MTKLPALKAKDVIRALEKLGFMQVRQQGSHLYLKHRLTGKRVPVYIHGGKDIKPESLQKILKAGGISREDFLNTI